MKRKSIITLGIAAAMGATVLAGCNADTKEKQLDLSVPANAKELAESVLANMENITSVAGELTEKYSGETKSSGYSITMDLDMTMKTKGYTEGKVDTSYAEMEMEYKMTGLESLIGAENSNKSLKYEAYSTGSREDGKFTNYVKTDDGNWTKTEVSVPITLLDGQSSIYKAIADGKAEAKLAEGTEKVNGKEAYKMESVITGDLFQNALGGVDMAQSAGMDSVDLSKLSIPVTLYVYKDTKYPAKVEMDAKEFGEQMYSQMTSSAVGTTGLEMNLKEFEIEMNFDDYNSVKKFTIPQDVIDAAGGEAESAAEEASSAASEAASSASEAASSAASEAATAASTTASAS